MEVNPSLLDYMVGMLLHDIGKAIFKGNEEFGAGHKRPSVSRFPILKAAKQIDFWEILDSGKIGIMDRHQDAKFSTDSLEEIAVGIADRLQKAMHEVTDENGFGYEDKSQGSQAEIEIRDKRIAPFKKKPPYYPYYGQTITEWNSEPSINLVSEFATFIKERKKLNLKTALDSQRYFLNFPHTSYIPHISLASHHRFSAAIFYLIYLKLAKLKNQGVSPDTLKEFKFSLIHISPQSLSFFYKMKDIRGEKKLIIDIRKFLFDKLFKSNKDFAPLFDTAGYGMSVDANPFEFPGAGSLILVYLNKHEVEKAVSKMLLENPAFPAISVFEFEYSANIIWVEANEDPDVKRLGFVSPGEIDHCAQELIEHPNIGRNFPAESLGRCMRCNSPSNDIDEGMCPICRSIPYVESEFSLEDVAKDYKQGETKIGFVVLRNNKLFEQAKTVAEKKLLKNIESDYYERLKNSLQNTQTDYDLFQLKQQFPKPPLVTPSETGIFEFLQAVSEIETFRNDILYDNKGVYEIQTQPEMLIWVMNEKTYWEFLPKLFGKLNTFRLEHNVFGVTCSRKAPFWNIINKVTKIQKLNQEFSFFDITGGEIMSFTDNEISKIRELSKKAGSRDKTQLTQLIRYAQTTSLEGLLLEVDIRKRNNKLKGFYANMIKEALQNLKPVGSAEKDQIKRALFLKKIREMIG